MARFFDDQLATFSWGAGDSLADYAPEAATNAASDAPTTGFKGGGFNVGVFGAVVSGLSNAYSSYVSGKMAADTMTFNAKLKEIQGRMMRHTAKLNADRTRKQGVRFIAGQKAKYLKAGVTSEGSPVNVMIDSMANFELDARITEINAEMGAASKQHEAATMRSRGDFFRGEGVRKAGSTLLTTTLDVIGNYYNPKG